MASKKPVGLFFTGDLLNHNYTTKKSYTSTTQLKAQLIKITGSIDQEILENAIKSLPGRFNELQRNGGTFLK